MTDEIIRGDVLSKREIEQRGIIVKTTEKGGLEMKAPTYQDRIVQILIERGFLEEKAYWDGCDYLELKNSLYGFLNAKTMAGIFQQAESGFKKTYGDYGFKVAYNYLGKIHHGVIERAMNEAPRKGELDRIAVVEAYRLSFDRLQEAMTLAKKAVADQIELDIRQHHV
jgi:hypothetical protein